MTTYFLIVIFATNISITRVGADERACLDLRNAVAAAYPRTADAPDARCVAIFEPIPSAPRPIRRSP